MTREELQSWIRGQDWYQTIELSNGLVTPGKVDSRGRHRFLERLDVRGRRVLDVGCNSGAYSLWAKRRGASEVVGVDIDEKRLEQARQLARHEGVEVAFHRRSVLDIEQLGRFDIVFCFAVLTEVRDLLGALHALGGAIGGVALVELALARPLAYVARSRLFGAGFKARSGRNAVLELRRHKRGWMIVPTLEVVASVLGADFEVLDRGPSVRYQMLEIRRTTAL
jgi:SAM-dependent methyltransferase